MPEQLARMAMAITWLKDHHEPADECARLVRGVANILDGRDAFDPNLARTEERTCGQVEQEVRAIVEAYNGFVAPLPRSTRLLVQRLARVCDEAAASRERAEDALQRVSHERHTESVSFRLSPRLVGALEALAEAEQTSISELVREALRVRWRIALDGEPSVVHTPGMASTDHKQEEQN